MKVTHALVLSALLVSGCAKSSPDAASTINDSVGPSQSSTSAPGGSQVIAPIMIDPMTVTDVSVALDNTIVLTVDEPAKWTATYDENGPIIFMPGGDTDGYTANPALTPNHEGETDVTLKDPSGGTHVLHVTVTAAAGRGGLGSAPLLDISPEMTDMATHVIGMKENEATAAISAIGGASRIGRRDAEYFPLTMDYSTNRITLEIDNGIVTQANIG